MARRRPQLPLPGIEPGNEPIEITIPTMDWEQIGGDVDPGAHGGVLASADGRAIELIEIQPVRDYVGDKEAADVGFPFWTKRAYFDAADLNLDNDDVQSAMQSVGLNVEALEDMKPEQRAIALAEALLQWGRGDEGPAGWSADIEIPSKVKWWGGKVEGAEYLADEDDAFRNEVLGYDDIRSAVEETVQRFADQRNAEGWSTVGDQTLLDLEKDGYDPSDVVGVTDFGGEVAVNGDYTEESEDQAAGDLRAARPGPARPHRRRDLDEHPAAGRRRAARRADRRRAAGRRRAGRAGRRPAADRRIVRRFNARERRANQSRCCERNVAAIA